VIRPAVLGDLREIEALVLKETDRYEKLKADKEKVRSILLDLLGQKKHYCLVSVNYEDQIEGALLTFVGQNSWAQRLSAHVMFWVSDKPGDGATMLRMFRDWLGTRRGIKVAGFAPDIDVDERVWKLAERIGFQKHGGAYLRYQ